MKTNKKPADPVNYFGEDYFSRRLGYVIEGQCMAYTKAITYLVNNFDMENHEAQSYLTHLHKRSTVRMGVC